MLNSNYVLVFIDMFLGCVTGYLIAPYINYFISIVYRKLKKKDIDFTNITKDEARELYRDSISKMSEAYINVISEMMIDGDFQQTDGGDVFVVTTVKNKEVAKKVRAHFQDLTFPVLIIKRSQIESYYVYVFIVGDGNGVKEDLGEEKQD